MLSAQGYFYGWQRKSWKQEMTDVRPNTRLEATAKDCLATLCSSGRSLRSPAPEPQR